MRGSSSGSQPGEPYLERTRRSRLFEARGFITLLSRHRYRQGRGAVGRTRFRNGITRFIGGGLDKGTAELIRGDRTHIFLKLYFKSGEAHWSC